MTKLIFGQRVTFERHYLKNKREKTSKYTPLTIPRCEGSVIGVRHLAIGVTSYGGYEEGFTFKRTGTEKFVLVAYDLNRKPVFVKEEDLMEATDDI